MARIVIAADTFMPQRGGSEQLLAALAEQLSREYSVAVFTPSAAPQLEKDYDQRQSYVILRSSAWGRLFRYGGSRSKLLSRSARMLIVFLTYTKLSKLCRDADLLIIGHALPLGALSRALVRQNPRLKTLLITYGEEISVYSRGTRMKSMLCQLLQSVDAVTCLTSNGKAVLEKTVQFQTPVEIIPPPVDAAIGAIGEETVEQTKEFLGIEDRRMMLTVSRLVPRKGIDNAIHAFARIHQDYPDLVYLVIGSGPDQSRLAALARAAGLQDKVRFLAVTETKAYYHACDFFVMPNRTMPDGEQEGFGIVFLEAGLAGKPSIAGNSGGAADAVVHEKTGLVVDSTDQEAVAGAMRRLLDDPESTKNMGSAARAHAQHFTVPIFGEKYQKLVARILAKAEPELVSE